MIFAKTELGQQVVKDRSVALSASQRAFLIMCDGVKPLQQLLGTVGIAQNEVEQLVELKLIADLATGSQAGAPTNTSLDQVSPATSPAAAYDGLYKTATKITSGLGLRGFRLNMAIEGASNAQELWALRSKIYDALVSANGATTANAQIQEFDAAAKL
jgi:hypothetical protein